MHAVQSAIKPVHTAAVGYSVVLGIDHARSAVNACNVLLIQSTQLLQVLGNKGFGSTKALFLTHTLTHSVLFVLQVLVPGGLGSASTVFGALLAGSRHSRDGRQAAGRGGLEML